MNVKVCSKCKQEKELSFFNKDNRQSNASGVRAVCKECSKLVRKNNHSYYQKYHKNYYQQNKKDIEEYNQKYYEKNRLGFLLRGYKKVDKKNGLHFDLDIKWIEENIINKSCVYCGSTENIGCDRINNYQGHIKNNCQPCCDICNSVRGNIFTIEEMKQIGLLISKIRSKRKLNNLEKLKRRK